MAKKDNSKDTNQKYKGLLDASKVEKKTIKPTTTEPKEKKVENRGKKLITPKHWVNLWCKLDPEVKTELTVFLARNKQYSSSTLINELLAKKLLPKK